jgi:hypothetical protein
MTDNQAKHQTLGSFDGTPNQLKMVAVIKRFQEIDAMPYAQRPGILKLVLDMHLLVKAMSRRETRQVRKRFPGRIPLSGRKPIYRPPLAPTSVAD